MAGSLTTFIAHNHNNSDGEEANNNPVINDPIDDRTQTPQQNSIANAEENTNNNDDLSAFNPIYDPHKRIREEDEKSYFSNTQSQLLKYITNSAKLQRAYVIGDIIDLKISDVDRTISEKKIVLKGRTTGINKLIS
ncbi:unnamed protein product [Didymodactylos carnosus]|uniref:Uncharacterized protein n=1 Tax=Didymodactylos carnosus TaxID=1234261 RepID=A0A815JW24_9BILA|nr:unnamed protein product [Didymodactylos carnosus]CAF1459733.1 unnamed protein product [Didymodactylos carnosus]CAF4253236.1 unnamed protein product [Didymodactylos carnosus]CAF4281771.1 unnamed protein product [Didymodactylos carnosus]